MEYTQRIVEVGCIKEEKIKGIGTRLREVRSVTVRVIEILEIYRDIFVDTPEKVKGFWVTQRKPLGISWTHTLIQHERNYSITEKKC